MRTNPWKLSTFVLLGGLFASQLVAPAVADRQPHMRSALAGLKQAKAQLEKASPDKGGHRVKALSLVNQAIDEVQEGIKHDNRH